MNPGVGLAVLGGLSALVSLGQFFNPQIQRVEDKAYLDQMAGEWQNERRRHPTTTWSPQVRTGPVRGLS